MPSSVIATMHYDAEQRTLTIVYRGKRGIYRYFDVAPEEYDEFLLRPVQRHVSQSDLQGTRASLRTSPLISRDSPRREIEQRLTDNAETKQWQGQSQR